MGQISLIDDMDTSGMNRGEGYCHDVMLYTEALLIIMNIIKALFPLFYLRAFQYVKIYWLFSVLPGTHLPACDQVCIQFI